MKVTLDGQRLFDEQALELCVSSFGRESIDRAVPGLNGILSIDLGRRGRKIKQTGTLRAKSRSQLDERISDICACMDGHTHTLVTSDGRQLSNLRMDSFDAGQEHLNGASISVDYEIVYTQLA
jgi:hypothetical protein